MQWKIGVNMPGLSMYGELISRLVHVPVTKMEQAPSRQHRGTPSIRNISCLPGNFVWHRRPFAYKRGVSDVTPVSSSGFIRVNYSVAHSGTTKQWYCAHACSTLFYFALVYS